MPNKKKRILKNFQDLKRSIVFGFILIIAISSCNIASQAEAAQLNENGLIAMDNGELELAIDYFKQAINKKGLDKETEATCLRNLAVAWDEFGNTDSSKYYSLKAAEVIGKNTYEYELYLADVDMIDGNTASAIERLERAKTIGGENMEICNLLGLIYLGEYGEDFIDFEQAVYYNRKAYQQGESRATTYLLALSEYYTDNNTEALSLFQSMRQHYPQFLDAMYFEGVILLENGELEEGIRILEELRVLDPSYSEIIDQDIASLTEAIESEESQEEY